MNFVHSFIKIKSIFAIGQEKMIDIYLEFHLSSASSKKLLNCVNDIITTDSLTLVAFNNFLKPTSSFSMLSFLQEMSQFAKSQKDQSIPFPGNCGIVIYMRQSQTVLFCAIFARNSSALIQRMELNNADTFTVAIARNATRIGR